MHSFHIHERRSWNELRQPVSNKPQIGEPTNVHASKEFPSQGFKDSTFDCGFTERLQTFRFTEKFGR
jgi:hypothetical protein